MGFKSLRSKITFFILVGILLISGFQNCSKGSFSQKVSVRNVANTNIDNQNSTAIDNPNSESPDMVNYNTLLTSSAQTTDVATGSQAISPKVCQFNIKKYLDMGFKTTFYSQLDKDSGKMVVYQPDSSGNMSLPINMAPYSFDLHNGDQLAVSFVCREEAGVAKLSTTEWFKQQTSSVQQSYTRQMTGTTNSKCGVERTNFLQTYSGYVFQFNTSDEYTNWLNQHPNYNDCTKDRNVYYFGNIGGQPCSADQKRTGLCCEDGTTQAWFQLSECR